MLTSLLNFSARYDYYVCVYLCVIFMSKHVFHILQFNIKSS